MKFINESVYWHGAGKLCNFLNRLLLEVLGCGTVKILKIFFYKGKIFPLLEELSQNKHSLFYNRMKVFKVN
jgi:hypothetical protein